MKVKDIIRETKGKLIIGNIESECDSFCKDTRILKPEDTYIGIKGENFDGSTLWKQAFEKGAKAVIIQNINFSKNDLEKWENKIIIEVEDTIEAIAKIATYKRELQGKDFQVVGVTGSVGKTSTKDIISNVVSQKYKTLKTQGNNNNNIGLPFTIFNLQDQEAAVIEMGMNHFGELSKLTKIAKPTISVITNVGTSHIGNLGSRENILQAKMEIVHGMNHGTLVVNNDNDLLSTVHPEGISLKTIGIESDADLKATDIILNEDMSSFRVKVDGQDYDVRVYVPGVHFIFNALIAIQVGLLLDIPMEKCIKGIETFELTKNRNDILTLDRHIRVIDGTYNANLDSMKSSIDVLSGYAGRKIAVLGDMLELGDYEETLHRAVGAHLLKKNIDLVLTVGPAARYISDEVNKAKPGLAYHFDDNASLSAYLQECLEENDVVLVKASNGMHLKEVINDLKENN